MEAINVSNKSLFGDGSETTYTTNDDDEDNSNEELQPCPKKKISIKGEEGGNQIFQAQFEDYIEINNKIFWLEW
jgi:hypothetical protein